MKRILTVLLILSLAGAVFAQSPITFSGAINTGIRLRTNASGQRSPSVDIFNIQGGNYAGNDITLSANVNQSIWGVNFQMGFNDIGTTGAVFSKDNIINANAWLSLLNDVLYVRVGRIHAFEYGGTINIFWTTIFGGVDKAQIELRPVEGLKIAVFGDFTSMNSDNIIRGDGFGRNLDAAFSYRNSTFNLFGVYQGKIKGAAYPADSTHEIYWGIGFTGVENLTAMLDGQVVNLQDRDLFAACFNAKVGYRISDSLSADIGFFIGDYYDPFAAGQVAKTGLFKKDKDGFTLEVRPTATFKLSDALSLNGVIEFALPDTSEAAVMNLTFHPTLIWNVAPGANVYFAYKIGVYNLGDSSKGNGKDVTNWGPPGPLASGSYFLTPERRIVNTFNVAFSFSF